VTDEDAVNHRRWGMCLLIAAMALFVSVPAASADSIATIVTMNGPAEIEKDGSTVVGVVTGANTTVMVQIDATQDVTVYQHTQLRLGEVLHLRVGTVRVRGSLTVTTASTTTIVRDSEMTVAYDEQSGITTIEVTDREATVRGTNDVADQVVPAGQMVRVGTDGRTTTAQAISPVEITAARTAPPGGRTTDRERALPYLVMIAALACLLVGVGGLAGSKRVRPAPTPA
jgi:hypothetical protein